MGGMGGLGVCLLSGQELASGSEVTTRGLAWMPSVSYRRACRDDGQSLWRALPNREGLTPSRCSHLDRVLLDGEDQLRPAHVTPPSEGCGGDTSRVHYCRATKELLKIQILKCSKGDVHVRYEELTF